MFTIIYDKNTGKVTGIVTASEDTEELETILGDDKYFLVVDELPKVKPYREEMVVIDGKLQVKKLEILDEQKQQIEEMELAMLRGMREEQCFVYINRGKLWYDKLTSSQVEELKIWYETWLDITDKYSFEIGIDESTFPQKPNWLK